MKSSWDETLSLVLNIALSIALNLVEVGRVLIFFFETLGFAKQILTFKT